MIKHALVAASITLSVTAAQAGFITFEAVTPATFLYGANDSFDDGAYRMTVLGDFGTVDTVAGLPQPLLGNATNFYAGYNDGYLSIARTDNVGFSLNGFDAGFVAPFFVGAGVSAGRIYAFGTKLGGGTVFGSWEFASSDANGNFSFLTYNNPLDFSPFSAVTSLQFAACIYTGTSCVNPAENLGQFAIDNINVTAVPEPSTYALMALGLAGLAWRARRAGR